MPLNNFGEFFTASSRRCTSNLSGYSLVRWLSTNISSSIFLHRLSAFSSTPNKSFSQIGNQSVISLELIIALGSRTNSRIFKFGNCFSSLGINFMERRSTFVTFAFDFRHVFSSVSKQWSMMFTCGRWMSSFRFATMDLMVKLSPRREVLVQSANWDQAGPDLFSWTIYSSVFGSISLRLQSYMLWRVPMAPFNLFSKSSGLKWTSF